eukprot:531869-Pyramimonas_sp.AAC.1
MVPEVVPEVSEEQMARIVTAAHADLTALAVAKDAARGYNEALTKISISEFQRLKSQAAQGAMGAARASLS